MEVGNICITGRDGLSTAFRSSRGIKQGCPASPLLFLLLIIGLQRRLERLAIDGVVKFGNTRVTCTQYADDIKLFARSVDALNSLFLEV